MIVKFIVESFNAADIKQVPQEFNSAKTSINSSKLPYVYSRVSFTPGDLVVDYGGGKFDNAVEYLKNKDVTLLIFDPYNRTQEHNEAVLRQLESAGGADAAINSNVLNVIKESSARINVLKNIRTLLKSGAPVYITVYEGDRSSNGKQTSSGYQLNRKTGEYMQEIISVFPNAERHGKLIFATK